MTALPAPPAPPPTFTDWGYGGGGDDALLLTDVPQEQRMALMSLWHFSYEHAHAQQHGDEDDADDQDLRIARYLSRWVGDLAPSGWFGLLRGRCLGAFLGTNLEQPQALIAVRYERDNSHWQKMLMGKHLMVVDHLLLSPALPDHLRPLFHAALLQTLVSMADYHKMTLCFLDDFDI